MSMSNDTANLRSGHAAIDSSIAYSLLKKCEKSDQEILEQLSKCYSHGSIAAAQVALTFISEYVTSEITAARVCGVLRALPPVIPPQNATCLASACASLAKNFDGKIYRAPLMSFLYCPATIKRHGVNAVLAEIRRISTGSISKFAMVMNRLWPFLEGILKSNEEPHIRFLTFTSLCSLGRTSQEEISEKVARLLISVVSSNKTSSNDAEDAQFMTFALSEIATFVTSEELFADLIRSVLFFSLAEENVALLSQIYDANVTLFASAVSSIGESAVLILCMIVACSCAIRGDISESCNSLQLATCLVEDIAKRSSLIDALAISALENACIAIGALSSAGARTTATRIAAQLRRLCRDSFSIEQLSKPQSHEKPEGANQNFIKSLKTLALQAAKSRLSQSSFCLSMLGIVAERWEDPQLLQSWLENEFSGLLKTVGLSRSLELKVASITDSSFYSNSEETSGRREVSAAEMNQEHFSEEHCRQFCANLFAFVSVACMRHKSPTVRLAAIHSFSRIPVASSLFYYLPTLLSILGDEENGAVAVGFVRIGLASSVLVEDRQASRAVVSSLLRLNRHKISKESTSAVQEVGICALARAACRDPTVACPALLGEVERIKEQFNDVSKPLRAATAGAIAELIEERPARGPGFIPFIQLCISREAGTETPEALSLCFVAMHKMVEEEVLHASKALKIVFKSFASPDIVPRPARLSYLRLIGCASQSAASKKGRATAATCIEVLRNFIIVHGSKLSQYSPEDSGGDAVALSNEVAQAASSLAKYTADHILRIAYANSEPEENADDERERLRAIEDECEDFVGSLLIVAGVAQTNSSSSAESLQTLCNHILSSEWENRTRGAFEESKLSKLRAASEALRRARGASDGSGKGPDPSLQFLTAAHELPPGSIRATLFQCARGSAQAVSLRAVVHAKAFAGALPWMPHLLQVISTNLFDACQAAAVACALVLSPDTSSAPCSRLATLSLRTGARAELAAHFARSEDAVALLTLLESAPEHRVSTVLAAAQAVDKPCVPVLQVLVTEAMVKGDVQTAHKIGKSLRESFKLLPSEAEESLLECEGQSPEVVQRFCAFIAGLMPNLKHARTLLMMTRNGIASAEQWLCEIIPQLEKSERIVFLVDLQELLSSATDLKLIGRLAATAGGTKGLLPNTSAAVASATLFATREKACLLAILGKIVENEENEENAEGR